METGRFIPAKPSMAFLRTPPPPFFRGDEGGVVYNVFENAFVTPDLTGRP